MVIPICGSESHHLTASTFKKIVELASGITVVLQEQGIEYYYVVVSINLSMSVIHQFGNIVSHLIVRCLIANAKDGDAFTANVNIREVVVEP